MYKKFSQDSSFKEHIKNMQKRRHTIAINVKKIFSEESSLKKHIKNIQMRNLINVLYVKKNSHKPYSL